MGESVKYRRILHLKLPVAMLEIVLKPTGCRASPEAEAAWLLGAAACAVRELKPLGVLPIFKDVTDPQEPNAAELHLHLLEEDLDLLTEVSKQEGGSRGELARKLLLTARRIVNQYPGMLNCNGLAAELVRRFRPLESDPPAEW